MRLFDDLYRGKRVLLTGHTGFKGSWLALWLATLGARVTGVALAPETRPNHWDALALDVDDRRVDIRDARALHDVVAQVQPDIVFHLAAQPLVRRSYRAPLETWSTNVMGTAHLLDACRLTESVKAIVVVTTDKCYENREWHWGYREVDALGGRDPYSASKAATELVVASYRQSYFQVPGGALLASARAGNVIGGGDWSEDRLIPDIVRSLDADLDLEIRSPNATRPWQHVLESLSGYLLLGMRLLQGESRFADAWNFGPEPDGNRPVAQVLSKLALHWPRMRWHIGQQAQVHEAKLLYLDSAKARTELDWRPVWPIDDAIRATAQWYDAWRDGGGLATAPQLDEYVACARDLGRAWVAV